MSSIKCCFMSGNTHQRGSEFQCIFRGLVDQFALTLPPESDDRSVQIWA